jgi:hypothetical protein
VNGIHKQYADSLNLPGLLQATLNMNSGSTEQVLPECRQLTVHYGGNMLMVNPTAPQMPICTQTVRCPLAPEVAQAAFDAGPAIREFQHSIPDGFLDAAGDAIQAAAAAVSSALHDAIPEPPEENDAPLRTAYVLAAARSALWDLVQLLFIAKGEEHCGSIAPDFVDWAYRHTLVLSTEVPGDISKWAPHLLSKVALI